MEMYNISEAFKALDDVSSIELKEDYEKEEEKYTFNLNDADDIEQIKVLLDDADNVEEDPIEMITDIEAEEEEDLKDTYVGDVILQCKSCKEKIYKKKDDLVLADKESEEDEDIYNVEEECPHCSGHVGYLLIGEVAPYNPEESEELKAEVNAEEGTGTDLEDKTDIDTEDGDEEVNVEDDFKIKEESFKRKKKMSLTESDNKYNASDKSTIKQRIRGAKNKIDNAIDKLDDADSELDGLSDYVDSIPTKNEALTESDKPAALSIDDAQRWVDYDIQRYGKISARTNRLVHKAGFQIIKDRFGDYEVAAGKYESCNEKCEDGKCEEECKESCELKEEPIYDLSPQHDSRKSFYGKAKVDTGANNDQNKLYSYNTLVAEIKDGKPVVYGTYSPTTLRHIKDWLKQNGFKAETLKQIVNDYLVKDESLLKEYRKPAEKSKIEVIIDKLADHYGDEYVFSDDENDGIRIEFTEKKDGKFAEKVADEFDLDTKDTKNGIIVITADLKESCKKKLEEKSQEIDRNGFASLIKYDDPVFANAKYGVLNDGNFCYKFWAKDDDEAKKIFNKYGEKRPPLDKNNELVDESCNKKECNEEKCEEECKESTKLTEAPIYDLTPQNDGRKSFYGKAKVDTGKNNDENKLYSYNTLVAEIKDGKPVVYGTYSQTTLRHIKDWLQQNGFRAVSGKQIMADYGVKDESYKVDECDEAVVEECQKEECNEEKCEECDNVKIEEIDENLFNTLVNNYIKEVYDNVDSYTTTSGSVDNKNGQVVLEGKIKFKSGKEQDTKFIFENATVTKKGKIKLVGLNETFTKNKKAFMIQGFLNKGNLLTESFNYNYSVKTDDKARRLYGTFHNELNEELKIIMTMSNYEPWAGAVDTYNKIVDNGLWDKFEAILEEQYPDGIEETQLNDLLWFDPDWCLEMIGLKDEEDDYDEDEVDESCKKESCKESYYGHNEIDYHDGIIEYKGYKFDEEKLENAILGDNYKVVGHEFTDDSGDRNVFSTWMGEHIIGILDAIIKNKKEHGGMLCKEFGLLNESLNESKYGFKRKYKGCSIHERPDVFVVTNEHGKTIGQSKTEAGCEAIIDDYLAKDESLKESQLNEKKWELKLKAGAGLRDAIENEDGKLVIDELKKCYKEINEKRPDLLDEDELNNILDDLDVSFVEEEDFEDFDNIDYYLNDLYDFCDNSGIWLNLNEELKEDTVKQNGKWVNKGKEGTHGKFKTKKAADAQRKAMFASGYKAKDESLKESEEDMEKVFVYQFPPLSVYDKKQLPKYNLEVSDIIETDFHDPDVEVKGKLKDLIRYGQNWLGGYELVKEYLKPIDEELKEDYEDFSDRWDEIKEEIVAKVNEKFPDAIDSTDIEFDDSRAWSLFVRGSKLGLPVNKFGAYRNYLGGGVRGAINNNGREEDGTVELGRFFENKLKEIEDLINEGSGDEPWEKNTGVLQDSLKKSKEDKPFKLLKDGKKLNEEVSDVAYDIAEEIDERFSDVDFITFDEFNEAFEDAYPGLIDWTDDKFNDIESDVRAILGFYGWETIFEGEDEGGLRKLTDIEFNEAVDVTDKVIVKLNEPGFISKKHDLEAQGYKLIGSGNGQMIYAKPKEIKEESLNEDINKVVINPDEDDEIRFEADDIDALNIQEYGNDININIHRKEEYHDDDWVVDDEFDDEIVDTDDVNAEIESEFSAEMPEHKPEMIVPTEDDEEIVDDVEVNAEVEAEFGNKEEQ